MYNFKLQYIDQNNQLNNEEFQSPSAYVDQTTLAYMQIHLNTIVGGYENASAVGIITITPVNLSCYGLTNQTDTTYDSTDDDSHRGMSEHAQSKDISDWTENTNTVMKRSYSFSHIRNVIVKTIPNMLQFTSLTSVGAWLLGVYNIPATAGNALLICETIEKDFDIEKSIDYIEELCTPIANEVPQAELIQFQELLDNHATKFDDIDANLYMLGRYKIIPFAGCLNWMIASNIDEYKAKIETYMHSATFKM